MTVKELITELLNHCKAWIEATIVEREACADICRELYYNDGITCAEYIMERE